MSTFAVEIRVIEKCWKHPNADKLSLAKVEGIDYQFVVMLNEYQPGDLCVYFPIDSVLPEELVKKIGLEGKLAGKLKNRVKTIKLRKEISQGICTRPALVFGDKAPVMTVGQDITNVLGVTKYEPAPDNSGGANNRKHVTMGPRPSKVSYYDIEGPERHRNVVEALMVLPCYITEKLEGMNIAVLLEKNGDITICSRNCTTHFIPGSFWGRVKDKWAKLVWRLKGRKPRPVGEHYEAAVNSGWLTKIVGAAKTIRSDGFVDLILRGEVLGPQVLGNIYKLTALKAVVFDIEIVGHPTVRYVSPGALMEICKQLDLECPPVLSEGKTLAEWLNGKTLAEASTGPSVLLPSQLREGVVIKPMIEQTVDRFGRMYLKKRSPEYLAENDN